MTKLALLLGSALVALTATAASAQVKIGMITTLSGPGGYLGEDIRDAFALAIEQEGGKLGGVPVQLLVEDDALKPGTAKQVAEKFIKSEKAKIITGINFSNVLSAVLPDILEAGAFYVSPNAAPSNFAGKDCDENYFVASWQKDALAGFKRMYKGEVVAEIYTKLDQTDFSAELAQIRAAKPDAVFQFHPGGLGITFMKQYVQAGLKQTIPMVVPAPSLDSRILEAVGDAALGVQLTSQWNADFDNPASQQFVADFQKKYNRLPTFAASQGYDTARLIASALKATGGKVEDAAAFRGALRKADFQAVRGAFKFANNQHPIQDWYALGVANDGGKLSLKTTGKVLTNHGDAYAKDCKLKWN
ncbi:MAG: ABC transporter substrate-binding protein [Alphaproteobacteria bacterium]|nr:ABC transporter substrate-binding protein [Alphaproteobacteria bacterium]